MPGRVQLPREHASGDDADIRVVNACDDLRDASHVTWLERLLAPG